MTQGKVIAVKPPVKKGGVELKGVDSTELAVDTNSNLEDEKFEDNLVFIEHDVILPSGPTIKNVVCFIDRRRVFKDEDKVNFNFDDMREITIGLVKNVSKP